MVDIIDYKIHGDDIQMLGGFKNMLFGGEVDRGWQGVSTGIAILTAGRPASGVGSSEVGEERSFVGRLLGD